MRLSVSAMVRCRGHFGLRIFHIYFRRPLTLPDIRLISLAEGWAIASRTLLKAWTVLRTSNCRRTAVLAFSPSGVPYAADKSIAAYRIPVQRGLGILPVEKD